METVIVVRYDPETKGTLWCANVVDGKPLWTSDFAYAAHLSPCMAKEVVAKSWEKSNTQPETCVVFPMKTVRL